MPWSTPLTLNAATAVLSAVVLTAKAKATDTSSGCAPTLFRKSMNFWLSRRTPGAVAALHRRLDGLLAADVVGRRRCASSGSLFGRSNDGSAEDDSVADALATCALRGCAGGARQAEALALDELPDEQAARARASAAMRPRGGKSGGHEGQPRSDGRRRHGDLRPSSVAEGYAILARDQRRWMERCRFVKRPSPAAPFQFGAFDDDLAAAQDDVGAAGAPPSPRSRSSRHPCGGSTR